MKILIQTVAGDIHAAAVIAALGSLGIEALVSMGTDVPDRQTLSFAINGEEPETMLDRPQGSVLLDSSTDLVWSRRAKLFRLPDIHPDDVEVAQTEFRLFLEGFWQMSAPRAIWINPWQARARANGKVIQLSEARRCGFSISPTLASHDPGRIIEFVNAHGAENVIFKTFGGASWEEDGRHFATPTVRLDDSILNQPQDLRLCPGIYQRYIDKEKELRVTVMGDRVYCVELVAGSTPGADVDWRVGQHELEVRPFALPEAVADKCRRVVKELGLLFGCIDLIISRDGDCYFLEINEMGQFLWIERLCPQEHYLEAFVQFLFRLCGSDTRPSGLRLADVQDSPVYKKIVATTLAPSVETASG